MQLTNKKEEFIEYIREKKPLNVISNELLADREKGKMLLECLDCNSDMLTEYIDFIIEHGLQKRYKEGKPLERKEVLMAVVDRELYYGVNGKYVKNKVDGYSKLIDLIYSRYDKFCEKIIEEHVQRNIALKEVRRSYITERNLFEKFALMGIPAVTKYLDSWIERNIVERQLPVFAKFMKDILGVNYSQLKSVYDGKPKEVDEVYHYIKEYIDSRYDECAERLLEGNKNEIALQNDVWCVAYLKGPRLRMTTFDFSKIESREFRFEVKLYIKDKCSNTSIDKINSLSLLHPCVNFLYSRNKKCNSFSQITLADVSALDAYLQTEFTVKRKYDTELMRSPNTVRKMVKEMGRVSEFLIRYSKKNELPTSVPEYNVFSKTKYSNMDAMSEKTLIIPEIVMEQLELHVGELREEYQLFFEIFANTGLRCKSIEFLEDNCIQPSRYEGVSILRYNPFKIENFKKIKGDSKYDELIIPNSLAERIEGQIQKTKELREKFNLKYIFIRMDTEHGNLRPFIEGGRGFCKAINKLIDKYNIIDYDGVLWNFTTRQMRKTLVYIMKENNASDAEIAYVLGHYNRRTLNRYYKEISEKRIEDLNNEFYKKRFKIDIGEENLEKFSEEERQCLYIDFLSNCRKVELGYCGKHIKDGVCNSMKCSTCSKICTGSDFLQEWIELRDDRQREINELKEYYHQNRISPEEYEEYKEFKSLVYELNLYENTIIKIREGK